MCVSGFLDLTSLFFCRKLFHNIIFVVFLIFFPSSLLGFSSLLLYPLRNCIGVFIAQLFVLSLVIKYIEIFRYISCAFSQHSVQLCVVCV